MKQKRKDSARRQESTKFHADTFGLRTAHARDLAMLVGGIVPDINRIPFGNVDAAWHGIVRRSWHSSGSDDLS